ncbi:LysR family transcriptional regulator [Megalodesulfovibrio paquesii]
MELADLRTLVAVIEQGGISRAAKVLHRVPSGVTTRILQLEASLGASLFLREGKRLLPTEAGRMLYGHALQVLALVAEAERQVRNGEPGGVFRIGAMESAAAVRLPRPLAALHAQYPRLELGLSTGTSLALYEQLLENRLDVAFVADAPADGRLERVAAFQEMLVLATPGGHAPVRQPGDLAGRTLLTFRDGCSYRSRLLGWFRAHGQEPARIAELASYHAILGGVAAGMGAGLVPAAVLEAFPERSAISVHALPATVGHAMTELIWRKGLRSPNITALQSCLAQAQGAAMAVQTTGEKSAARHEKRGCVNHATP